MTSAESHQHRRGPHVHGDGQAEIWAPRFRCAPRVRSRAVSTEGAAVGRDERLLSVAEVASYLGVPVKTLYQWRHKGVGPRAMRVGRHLRYRRSELDRWLDGLDGGRAGGASHR
jgi:excisionase family DNA binding protein